MSEHKMYTEEEARRLQRRAFFEGWRECESGAPYQCKRSVIDERAAHFYPLTRSVPRVVRDNEYAVEWRIVDGALQRRDRAGFDKWEPADRTFVTTARVRLWADLLANPTEDVTE